MGILAFSVDLRSTTLRRLWHYITFARARSYIVADLLHLRVSQSSRIFLAKEQLN